MRKKNNGENNYIFLSVIIPLYNEEERVKNIVKVIKYLDKQPFTYEIIAVDDGSTDKTLYKINYYKKKYNISVLSYNKNRGKGHAIKKGMNLAKGSLRLFIDVDLSTPISQIKKFLSYENKYDVLIGSRKAKGSRIIKRQSTAREYMGRCFTYLSQVILGVKFTDFTCGFKMFNKKSSKYIFGRTTIDRWGFDPEVVFLAKRGGFIIKEIPVVWKNDPRSKVRFPQDIVRSLKDLFMVKINSALGKYH